MVDVTINIEVSAVKGALNQIQRKIPFASKRGMAKASTFIQNAIKKRTEKGQSVNGGAFKPYSRQYRKVRAKRGASTTPNLFFSGQMLGNMTFKVLGRNRSKVFFPNTTQNTKAFFNDKTRPFFDVNNKEEDRAIEVFRKTFERELRI